MNCGCMEEIKSPICVQSPGIIATLNEKPDSEVMYEAVTYRKKRWSDGQHVVRQEMITYVKSPTPSAKQLAIPESFATPSPNTVEYKEMVAFRVREKKYSTNLALEDADESLKSPKIRELYGATNSPKPGTKHTPSEKSTQPKDTIADIIGTKNYAVLTATALDNTPSFIKSPRLKESSDRSKTKLESATKSNYVTALDSSTKSTQLKSSLESVKPKSSKPSTKACSKSAPCVKSVQSKASSTYKLDSAQSNSIRSAKTKTKSQTASSKAHGTRQVQFPQYKDTIASKLRTQMSASLPTTRSTTAESMKSSKFSELDGKSLTTQGPSSAKTLPTTYHAPRISKRQNHTK